MSLSSFVIGWPLTAENSSMSDHAIYIGVVQINHEQGDATAKLQIKVFADDLLDCLQTAFPEQPFFGEPEVCSKHLEAVETYFTKQFSCSINQQSSQLLLQNCQQEQDTYWLTFEMTCPTEWKLVELSAGFFMELFPDQSNVVQIKNGTQQRFAKTNLTQPSCQFHY